MDELVGQFTFLGVGMFSSKTYFRMARFPFRLMHMSSEALTGKCMRPQIKQGMQCSSC